MINLTTLQGKLLAALAIGGASTAVGFGAAWYVQGLRADARVADLQRNQAEADADAARSDLKNWQRNAQAVTNAASAALATNAGTARTLAALRKGMINAKPLPADCRPDADRLRRRNEAIDAYNRAAVGPVPGAAVQDN